MKKILILFLILYTSYSAQDYEAGKQLFRNNCASCHNMEKKVVGPALKNVVKNQGKEWTTAWIKNNNDLRASGINMLMKYLKNIMVWLWLHMNI